MKQPGCKPTRDGVDPIGANQPGSLTFLAKMAASKSRRRKEPGEARFQPILESELVGLAGGTKKSPHGKCRTDDLVGKVTANVLLKR